MIRFTRVLFGATLAAGLLLGATGCQPTVVEDDRPNTTVVTPPSQPDTTIVTPSSPGPPGPPGASGPAGPAGPAGPSGN